MAFRKPLDLFISCGELSGDQIGSELVKHLPSLQIAGVVGPELRSLGVTEIFPMESLQMIGFFQAIQSLILLFKLRKKLTSFILENNPKGVVLVDFSGFHISLAKELKRRGYKGKIIKVVCPQIWAWRKNRKKAIEQYYDALFTLFPFEADLFQGSPLKTIYIGHPAAKNILTLPENEEESAKKKPIISLFPGSRKKDIERNLPIQLRSIQKISSAEIRVGVSFEKYIPMVTELAKKAAVSVVPVLPKDRFILMRSSTLAIAKFGTISLELALSKTPTIMMIQLPLITAAILKGFFNLSLPFYALPNILLGRPLFKEILVNLTGIKGLEKAVSDLITSPKELETIRNGCKDVIQIFENIDPGKRGAEEILNLI